jgi:ubiquinone/menaquinone biosynthesis C-methylase UbiE
MSDEPNTYVVDHRSGAEMQRLIDQDRLMNQTMGDLFPQDIDPARLHSVLDVACGPAAWILRVAFEYPHLYAIGVDISQQMIDYGRAIAQVRHIDNVELRVMDVLRPWDFEDASFDFVNARLLEWFLKEHLWLPLLQEMLRVTTPGGTLRMTEILTNETNSPSFNRILGLIWEGWKRDGRTSLVEQDTYAGAGTRLDRFFAQAGISIMGEQIYNLDWSWGAPAHQQIMRDIVVLYTLMQPYLVNTVQVVSQQEYQHLLQSMEHELYSPDFQGTWRYKSVWGQKPTTIANKIMSHP